MRVVDPKRSVMRKHRLSVRVELVEVTQNAPDAESEQMPRPSHEPVRRPKREPAKLDKVPSPRRRTVPPASPASAPSTRRRPVEAPVAPASRAKGPARRSAPQRTRGARFLLFATGALVVANLLGLPYYALTAAGRVRHPLHPWLKPSGYVGQTAGIVALLAFFFLYLYPIRRRFRALAFLGALNRWLDVHIVLGLLIPIVGAMHASWRFQGLIGLGYASMLLVSLSGIAGRYLYTRIPRTRSGLELTLEEVEEQRAQMTRQIAETAGLPVDDVRSVLETAVDAGSTRSIPGAIAALLTSDVRRWKAGWMIRHRWAAGRSIDRKTLRQVVRLARRQIALTQQQRLLDATHRVFKFWHVVHRPFALTAFAAVAIHVVVVVALGVTWFW